MKCHLASASTELLPCQSEPTPYSSRLLRAVRQRQRQHQRYHRHRRHRAAIVSIQPAKRPDTSTNTLREGCIKLFPSEILITIYVSGFPTGIHKSPFLGPMLAAYVVSGKHSRFMLLISRIPVVSCKPRHHIIQSRIMVRCLSSPLLTKHYEYKHLACIRIRSGRLMEMRKYHLVLMSGYTGCLSRQHVTT